MPYERKEFPYNLKVGADMKSVANLLQLTKDLCPSIDFMMIDVCNALNFRDERTILSRDIALTRPGNAPLLTNFQIHASSLVGGKSTLSAKSTPT